MHEPPSGELDIRPIAEHSSSTPRTCEHCHSRLKRYIVYCGVEVHYFCSKTCAKKRFPRGCA